MAISKPSWLRSWLDTLNWDILTWHVYVGDAVESGIDWAIDWINWGITQAESAWNKAVAAWDKAVDVFWDLTATINWEVSRLWDSIGDWWDDLGEWWSTKVTWVRGLVDAASDFLKGLIDDVKRGLASLSVAWDNFWTTTWPQLLSDFNSLLVDVGNFFTQVLPGLATFLDISRAFEDFRLEWKDLFNFWEGFKDTIVAFFEDPEKWLLDKIETMLARFW